MLLGLLDQRDINFAHLPWMRFKCFDSNFVLSRNDVCFQEFVMFTGESWKVHASHQRCHLIDRPGSVIRVRFGEIRPASFLLFQLTFDLFRKVFGIKLEFETKVGSNVKERKHHFM